MSWTIIKSIFIFIFVERTLTSCNLRDFLNCLYKGRFVAPTFTIDTNSLANMFGKCRWILCRTQLFKWVKIGRTLEQGYSSLYVHPPPPVPNGGEADGRKLPHFQSSSVRWLVGIKTRPRIQKHFPESKPLLDSGKCFWILGRVLDSKTCFWILGSVLHGFWHVFCPYEARYIRELPSLLSHLFKLTCSLWNVGGRTVVKPHGDIQSCP